MAEKKRKINDTNGEGTAKKPPGRPKVLPPDLDKRHQLRCSSRDFDDWVKEATRNGFPNVSAWIRKVINDALPRRQAR